MFKIRLDFAAVCAIVMTSVCLMMPVSIYAAYEAGSAFHAAGVIGGCDREVRPERSVCERALINTTKQLTLGLTLMAGSLFLLNAKYLLSMRCMSNPQSCNELFAFSMASGATTVAALSLLSSMNKMYQ